MSTYAFFLLFYFLIFRFGACYQGFVLDQQTSFRYTSFSASRESLKHNKHSVLIISQYTPLPRNMSHKPRLYYSVGIASLIGKPRTTMATSSRTVEEKNDAHEHVKCICYRAGLEVLPVLIVFKTRTTYRVLTDSRSQSLTVTRKGDKLCGSVKLKQKKYPHWRTLKLKGQLGIGGQVYSLCIAGVVLLCLSSLSLSALCFQSFKSVARILGTALTERPDLRLIVCQALRLLVSKNIGDGKWEGLPDSCLL